MYNTIQCDYFFELSQLVYPSIVYTILAYIFDLSMGTYKLLADMELKVHELKFISVKFCLKLWRICILISNFTISLKCLE